MGVNGIVRKLARSYALERAQEVRSRLGDMLDREAALARKMADLPSLRAWMLDERNVGLRTEAFDRLDGFTRAFLDGNYFVVVGQSRTYYNKPADGPVKTTILEPNRPADIWYFNTMARNQDVSFNLDYNALVGAVRVWINCLVRDNGKVIGIAGTGIDISELVSRLVSAQGVGAQSMLTDQNGAVTAHPDVAFLEHNAKVWTKGKKITVFDLAGTQRDRTKLEDLMIQARAGKTAVDEVNLQGHTNLTAIVPVPEIGWMTVVSVDTSSFISFADFGPLFLVLVISVLVALAVIALLMERLILSPLTAVTDSANRIAAGDYELPLEFRRTDEIGILASAFKEMAVQVQRYTGRLEILVDERTAQLTETNADLKDANRRVMESIRFARMIQDGIMATDAVLSKRLSSHAFFHRQRDTVGGDFLFIRDVPGGFLLGVVDCEGHGVPGALMTMMVDSFLKMIASGPSDRDEHNGSPSGILRSLEQQMRTSLHQDTDDAAIQGGLDIGLCLCLPDRRTVVYAGAGMPLYVLEPDGVVSSVGGRRKAIGQRAGRHSGDFIDHTFPAEGRTFFLCTDGFVDQAGGSEGRAYGTKRLEHLLVSCGNARLGPQCPDWEGVFNEYRGEHPQRDDVLAVGFRLED